MQPYVLAVTFLKQTTVRISVDGKGTEEFSFASGDTLNRAAESSITIEFDQPESATILLNDWPVDFPEGRDGTFTLLIP